MPACGPPRSLSPLKETRSTPAARLSETSGSSMPIGAQVDHAAAAQVLVDGDAAFAPEGREFAQFGARGEAGDAEIAGMHAHEEARAVVDGGAVIVDTRCDWWCRLRAGWRRSGP